MAAADIGPPFGMLALLGCESVLVIPNESITYGHAKSNIMLGDIDNFWFCKDLGMRAAGRWERGIVSDC